MNIRYQSLFVMGLLLFVVNTGFAEENSEADSQTKPNEYARNIQVIRINASPALPPIPALKYTMRHRWSHQYEGNAAPMYYRAILLMQETDAALKDRGAHWYQIASWTITPIKYLPQEEVKAVLDQYQRVFQETRHGASRRYCNWEMPIQEHENDLFSVLMPEMAACKNISRLLALKIRYEISVGNIEQAVEDLRIGFTLAKHVGNGHFLVNGLFGVGISHSMLSQVNVLTEHTESPNLYWMLASLPDPTVDLSRAIESESYIVNMRFPQLEEALKEDMPDAYWDQQLNAVAMQLEASRRDVLRQTAEDPLAGMMTRAYLYSQSKHAKSELLKYGYSKTDAEAMSNSRAVLLYYQRTLEVFRDDLVKHYSLPFHQALPYTRILEKEFARNSQKSQVVFLASSLLPTIKTTMVSQAGNQRTVAVLRTVEAIRWHAAENEGQLPSALDKITVIPVPLNPMTGQPFNYRVQNQTAIIEMLEEYPGKAPMVIELTLNK